MFPLRLIYHAPRREGVWRSDGIAPPLSASAVVEGQWSASHPGPLMPVKESQVL
jgi:hypothetical protein